MLTMESFDMINIKRFTIDNIEVFDITSIYEEYYRIVFIVDNEKEYVSIRTNIEEFNDEPLFKNYSSNSNLQAFFIQAKIIFENFIENEFNEYGLDFDLEIMTIELNNQLIKGENMMEKFLAEFKLDRMSKDFIDIMYILDYNFLGEEILSHFINEDRIIN